MKKYLKMFLLLLIIASFGISIPVLYIQNNRSKTLSAVSAYGRTYNSSSVSLDTIKVGIVPQDGIAKQGSDGYYYGFDAEYTYRVAEYAGFIPIFIPYGNYDDVLSALEAGQIDMSVGVSKTPEREERFLYASNYYMQGTMSLCVLPDNTSYTYGSLSDVESMRIGVGKGSVYEIRLKDWADDNQITLHFTEYENETDLIPALQAGEIDAVPLSKTQSHAYRNILQIASTAYYPIFQKGNDALRNRVDQAITRISYENPGYATSLSEKYAKITDITSVSFTTEESDYITANPVLTIAVIADDAPYYAVTDSGAKGIIVDYYKQISEYTGMKCEYKVFDSIDSACNAVSAGEADVVGLVHFDAITAAKENVILTGNYSTQNVLCISETSTSTPEKAAVVRSDYSTFLQLIRNKDINLELIAYDSAEKCYEALEKNEVDSMLCCTAQSTWLSNNRRLSGYNVSNFYGIQVYACGAVAYNDQILSSIISKVNLFSVNNISIIISQNTDAESGIMPFLQRISIVWIIAAFLILFGIAALVMALIFYSKAQFDRAEIASGKAKIEAARQAREAESIFLSNMSHDMRTPLNGIIGFTNLALQTGSEENRQEYLQKINSSSKLMLNLVNDVLDLSKIESGKLELHPTIFNASDFTESIEASVLMLANSKGIYFKSDIQIPDKLYLKGDTLRMQQIALNLLSNAVKYTPSGGEVYWEIKGNHDSKNCNIITIVKDNGIGMSPSFQEKMYDNFTQEHQAGTENIQGTGLGLAIVKKIVDLMNGEIKVQSEVGKGTTFEVHLTLPLAVNPEQELDNALAGDERPMEEVLKDKKILLVEDNELNAEIAKINLAQNGCTTIDLATNGLESVALYEKSPLRYYDLILMDVRMPVMNGLEATARIRALDREDAKKIPIIAMTADSFESDVHKCLEAGMNEHIAKPLQVERLMKILRKYL